MTSTFFQTLIAQRIENPALPAFEGFTGEQFFQNLLPRLIGSGFVIGVIVFFFIMIIGAIQWTTSGGDKAAIEAARGKIANALVGVVILFSLFALFKLIGDFFGINILEIDFGPLKIGTGGANVSGPAGGGGGKFLIK